MNHEQRVKIANRVADLLCKKYGDDILLGGICGSTARETDTEYSDLEMVFIVKDKCQAETFRFAYEGMPVGVVIKKMSEVERDISNVELSWPLKMGTLFNLKITLGNPDTLKEFRHILDEVPKNKFTDFIAEETPLCFEGLGRLKAVKLRNNTYEIGIFIAEVLMEFMLLTAIFNEEFINHDYLGGLPESFKFKHLPEDYEETATKLMNWTDISLDEIIHVAETFVDNFVEFAAQNGIQIKTHTPLENLNI